MSSSIHAVSAHFDLQQFIQVRKKTISILDELVACIKIGMKESDVIQAMKQILSSPPVSKNWHPLKFRVDQNTTLSFSDQPLYDPIIGQDSFYFIDIGPVIDGYEGDYGETYYFGEEPQKKFLQAAAKKVFNYTQNIWRAENISGKELYLRASHYAQSLGLELNLRMDGHRLGDFPHQLYFKGGLAEIDDVPVENVWILEIHVIDPVLKLGAFYEDLLLKIAA
jgi:hypothetical protein